jgi:hypothetical protein
MCEVGSRSRNEVEALCLERFGRAVTQAISRLLATAAARVPARQSGAGHVFSLQFGFPCHLSHRLLHAHHHLPSGVGTIGGMVAAAPNGLCLTPSQKK